MTQDVESIISRATVGWNYRAIQRHRYGWRKVGLEVRCVMDDFGRLVIVGGWRNYMEK